MNIKQYRIQAGHYEHGRYTILWGGHGHWQLRDQFDEMIECMPTLRAALGMAIAYENYMHKKDACNG